MAVNFSKWFGAASRTREPFRVGFDVDGVLADLASELQAGIATREADRPENFWERLAECEPGGVARLAAVAAARQWEVVFLTRRPRTPGRTSQQQTQRWLEQAGFRLPSVCVVTQSRGQVALALSLDAVVDDSWDACIDVLADSHAVPLLMWRERPCAVDAQARALGIKVASTLEECFAALEAAERTPPQRG